MLERKVRSLKRTFVLDGTRWKRGFSWIGHVDMVTGIMVGGLEVGDVGGDKIARRFWGSAMEGAVDEEVGPPTQMAVFRRSV